MQRKRTVARLFRLGFFVCLGGVAAIVNACGSSTQSKVANPHDSGGDADAATGGAGGAGGADGQAGASAAGSGGAGADAGSDGPTDALWDVPYE